MRGSTAPHRSPGEAYDLRGCRPWLGYPWHAPEWRNGRRSGLKLRGPQGRPSSNLGSGTKPVGWDRSGGDLGLGALGFRFVPGPERHSQPECPDRHHHARDGNEEPEVEVRVDL